MRFRCQKAVDATGLQLLEVARQAWLSRHIDLVEQAAHAILALPLDPGIHDVAQYYRTYGLRKSGNSEQTRILLERLVDRVPPEYKARPLLGIGSCHIATCDFDESAKIYLEAARAANGINPLAKCQALRGLALVRSYGGDHRGSLADLERLFPVMRSFAAIYPEDYRYYLNNLAYELGEVGRIDEAKAAINVALRSPYAHRFPDWAETKQELETKRRRAFYPLSLAVGAPADEVVGDGEVNRSRPMPVVGASTLTSRVAYGRANATASCLMQAPFKSGHPAFVGAPCQKRLVEIIEGVARFRSQAAVDATGRQLVEVARRALLSRDFKLLDETVLALLALPLDVRTHAVARYYKAYSEYALRKSEGQQARLLLERLTDSVLTEYRPRTLIALGNCYASAHDYEESTRIYLDGGREATGTDPLTKCQAVRAVALLRSCDGDHKGSLGDLERLFPVMRALAASYPGGLPPLLEQHCV